MKINQIWEELQRDTSVSTGLLLRRYSGTILPNVYLALKVPENIRCIAASISVSIQPDLSGFVKINDIAVELTPDETRPNKNILLLKLLNTEHSDIFSVLCEDLMNSISTITDEAKLVKSLLNRYEKWKSLFDKTLLEGLSSEEQRGLFGELYFIRKLLENNFSAIDVINSWVGQEKQIKDFQSGRWAVEIKTSSGNNHQRVHINNERQLDTSDLDNLLLFHLSLNATQRTGENLNQIVDLISAQLALDFVALNRYKSKLLEGGYFQHHKSLYENVGYHIRQETFYKVENGFPRIEESDIRAGVGDVKYTIILSQCSSFILPETDVYKILEF